MSNNIPAQSTSFVGRETDIASICEILSQSDCRLLTLVGPGGIGKTRLSLEVASRLDDYEDGVHFVDLTPVLSGGYRTFNHRGGHWLSVFAEWRPEINTGPTAELPQHQTHAAGTRQP